MPVSRNIRLLGWFNFWGDFRPFAPIAILYYTQVSGSYALGMSIWSAKMLAQSVFEVPTGMFSDMIGRKRTLVYGAVAVVFAMIFYAIGGTYLALLTGAIFEGLGRALFSGNNDALLYDTLAESGQEGDYQDYLGKISSMFQVALAVSAVLGSLIAAISFQAVMWVSVIPMVLALVVSLRLVEPRVHVRESTNIYAHLSEALQHFVHNARLRALSIASILSYAMGESRWMIRSAFIATLWPVWAIGLSQMFANLSAAASYYFAGRIIRRFGEFRLLVGGTFIGEAVNLFVLLVPSVLSPLLMSSVTSALYGVNDVAVNNLMQQEFTDQQRGTMGSLNSLAGSITFAAFSFLLGALADRIGIVPALVIGVLLSLIPMVLYWKVLGGYRAEPEIVSTAEGTD